MAFLSREIPNGERDEEVNLLHIPNVIQANVRVIESES